MRQGILIVLSFLWLLCSSPVASQAQSESTDQVKSALEELHQWLGNDANGQHWREFLRSDELQAELSKGPAADTQTVQSILAAYQSAEPGLEMQRFQKVRESLDAWLRQLRKSSSDLPEAIQTAKSNFRPIPEDHVAQTRAQLDASVQTLGRWIDSSDPANAAAWKDVLKWDAMQTELAKGDEARPEILEQLVAIYKMDALGFESRPFMDVRESLTEHAAALRLKADEKIADTYAARLDDLAKRFEALATAPKLDDISAAGRHLGWLERAGQSPQLVRAARREFGKPNVFAVASERLVAAAFDDPLAKVKMNQPQAVNDNILGTQLYGTAYPNLNMSVQLIPADDRAAIDVQFYGGASSRNTGYRGPVTVFTNGYTQIAARKHVYFDANGATATGTGVWCATNSTIQSISANCGLIERIAWKQAGKQQPQAEAIASDRAEARFAGQVDAEMGQRLAEANQRYMEKFRNRLVRRNSFPREMDISSTDQAVLVRILHATPNQLTTSSDPPELTGNHDLALRVHETGVANFGETLLGGETLTDERLVKMLEESNAEVPEELRITPDKDPWSITFSNELPVSAQFSGNNVTIAIRGRRFTRGERVIRDDIEISAVYKLEKTATGSKLTRQGEVIVDYVNRRQLSVVHVTTKTFFQKKFDALFKPEIASDGLQLPDRFQNLGKLQLQQLNADQGWLTLGWVKPTTEDVPQVASRD